MLAYHNDPKIKDKYVNRMIAHRKADEVIQGTGYENGRGCAVGCTLNNYSHEAYETELGIPEQLAHLEDAIFEGLPKEEAPQFAQDFLEAVPVGADLSKVINKFYVWLLVDKEDGVIQYATDRQTKDAIRKVAFLHTKVTKGVRVREKTWAAAWEARDATWAAAWAARDAAWDAARDATWAAAWDAAWAAAGDAAGNAARDAAWAAAWAAAREATWDARDAAYRKMTAKLIELLKEAEQKEGNDGTHTKNLNPTQ